MSELRQRQAASTSSSRDDEKSTPQSRPQTRTDEDHGISLLDILRIIATLILAGFGTSYYMTNGESILFGYRPWYTRWPVISQAIVSTVTYSPTISPQLPNDIIARELY